MAVTPPTVPEFMARFPQFVGQEAQAEYLLNEAAQSVGDDWEEADQDPAVMYLAAHWMMMEGVNGAAASGTGAGSMFITSESIGPISRSYGGPSNSGADDS